MSQTNIVETYSTFECSFTYRGRIVQSTGEAKHHTHPKTKQQGSNVVHLARLGPPKKRERKRRKPFLLSHLV